MTAEEVKALVRNVPDFPIKGIQFKDITTVLDNPEGLCWMRDEMVRRYKDLGITKIVGIESRGFILAPAVAMERRQWQWRLVPDLYLFANRANYLQKQ